MAKYFMGIDVSTTASKALLIDEAGTVVATHSNPHELSTPRPLWSEQDPESDWWAATSKSIRSVLEEIPAEEVACVGLTGQMHGLTMLDGEGKSLRPALLWNDQRSGAQCAAITAKVGAKKLYQTIGSRLLAGFTAPKLMWVRENEPEVFEKIRHILLPKDYIRYRLSGEFASEVSGASGFGLMDIGTRDWSDDMLAAFDFPREWLPSLHESPEINAHVSEKGAAETGLKVGTPIVGGGGDQPAGGVGSGIVLRDQVSMAVGTSGVAYAISDGYKPEPDGRIHTFCGPMPDMWLYMGVMLSAAGGLRWLHDEVAAKVGYDELNKMAETVPAGSLGLLFAPYLTGERNPHPDPLARGAFVGLTLRHGLPHMTRAVMEGVAFGMRDQLELLRSLDVNPTESVVSGGAAKSPVWRQLMADIMGIPLYTVNTTEGAAFGAAILASVGVGAFADVPAAVARMVRRVEEFHPNPEGVETYDRLYPIFRDLYGALQDTFARQAEFESV